MSNDQPSFTAAELRGMKAAYDAVQFRLAIQSVCQQVKQHVVNQAKKGDTKFAFTMYNTYNDRDIVRIKAKLGESYKSPTTVSYEKSVMSSIQFPCSEELVGVILTELEKIFPDCVIEGVLLSSDGSEKYTVTIDWSGPPLLPPSPAPEQPSIESLQATIEALRAENAALKQTDTKHPDPFDLLEIFAGFGKIN